MAGDGNYFERIKGDLVIARLKAEDYGVGVKKFVGVYQRDSTGRFKRRQFTYRDANLTLTQRRAWEIQTMIAKNTSEDLEAYTNVPSARMQEPLTWVFRLINNKPQLIMGWENMPIFSGDIVEVGNNFQIRVNYSIGGVLFLGPNCRFQITNANRGFKDIGCNVPTMFEQCLRTYDRIFFPEINTQRQHVVKWDTRGLKG